LGCRFAIDDFGKGYSSFSYLKQLPVDYLKIDGSFVTNLENEPMNQTLVRAIGDIARAAGLQTIAECVESAATLALLAKLGIDYGQGFHIARPARTPDETGVSIEVPPRAPRPRAQRA
jgi:EAL domain-containing protein (putative c-di-GMP-specific phosphodiesterase class I)